MLVQKREYSPRGFLAAGYGIGISPTRSITALAILTIVSLGFLAATKIESVPSSRRFPPLVPTPLMIPS